MKLRRKIKSGFVLLGVGFQKTQQFRPTPQQLWWRFTPSTIIIWRGIRNVGIAIVADGMEYGEEQEEGMEKAGRVLSAANEAKVRAAAPSAPRKAAVGRSGNDGCNDAR